MPMNTAVREILPPNRMSCAAKYCRSNISRALRRGIAMISPVCSLRMAGGALAESSGGNISRTAAFIGMERSALHRKLKGLGIGGDGQRRADNAVATPAERSMGRGWR